MARAIGTGGRYATLPTELKFDTTGLEDLARDFEGAANLLKTESRVVLLELGEKVLDDAKEFANRASTKSGTNTVADSIRGGLIDDGLTFRGTAGGDESPIAALWELGNRNKASATDNTFWHPIYGKGRTYQQRYPFFRPALKKNRYQITKQLYQMWDRVLTPYRLRPSGTE